MLIFIPDISGFTRFVNDNEITHSRHIVEELLEILIDANEIDLEVSEIEGDAILFYRQGRPPTAAELLAQVQRMYIRFHGHLKKYDALRICRCGACNAACGLKLKFVTHFGDLSKKQVKNFSKLFGKDLIIAHRLMKNTISLDEYILFTHDLLNACSAWVEMKQVAWSAPEEGEDTYDGALVRYCYLPLSPLSVHVPQPRVEDYSIGGATTKVLQVEGVISAPLPLVFDVASDVSFRHHWVSGLTGSGELNGKVTKHGSTHRCIMSGTDKDPFIISHKFNINRDVITWIETDKAAKWDIVIKLERISDGLTRIYYTFFIKPNFFYRLMFNLRAKKMLTGWLTGNFQNLDICCRELVSEGRTHSSHIEIAA